MDYLAQRRVKSFCWMSFMHQLLKKQEKFSSMKISIRTLIFVDMPFVPVAQTSEYVDAVNAHTAIF